MYGLLESSKRTPAPRRLEHAADQNYDGGTCHCILDCIMSNWLSNCVAACSF